MSYHVSPSVRPLGITCLQRMALYRIWMIFAFMAALISVSWCNS